ncbi:hypothetical protein [Seleniivibrio sp.]|uniref:hypothetical protein n=1 Tax=Seleniivibrio sp. TaxID=2898801 RepID=UPI0025F638A6|nr:hypothetical protein [Seleniivibrio sp.]MCD8554247.1 hypothetical protein [Seleniivibrio sp.]
MKNITLVIICLLIPCSLLAADGIGSVKKYTGRIELFDGSSPRPAVLSAPDTALNIKNKVASKRASTALVVLTTGDKISPFRKCRGNFFRKQ